MGGKCHPDFGQLCFSLPDDGVGLVWAWRRLLRTPPALAPLNDVCLHCHCLHCRSRTSFLHNKKVCIDEVSAPIADIRTHAAHRTVLPPRSHCVATPSLLLPRSSQRSISLAVLCFFFFDGCSSNTFKEATGARATQSARSTTATAFQRNSHACSPCGRAADRFSLAGTWRSDFFL